MSIWAQKKAELTLDWRAAWREIAELTKGEQPADVCRLVLECDDRYKAGDKSGFVALVWQLRNRLSPAPYSSGSMGCPDATPGKYPVASSPADGQTLWDVMAGASSASK